MTPNLKAKPDSAAPVSARPLPDVSTHVLVPSSWVQALRNLARATRVFQSDYLREVVAYLLTTHGGEAPASPSLVAPAAPQGEQLVSVVFRLDLVDLESLRAISKRTRIRRSEYLREGLWALLTKHGAAPVATEELLTDYNAQARAAS